jgi:Rrf2 family protein
MFSKTFEYSMRAIVTLAVRNGKACTAQQVSELTQVPAPYLSKVLNSLVRSGLVRSQRGIHGGFALASNPNEIRVLDIVDAVEPFKRIRKCPMDLDAPGLLCSLHRFLDDLMALSEHTLRTTTVADLLQDPGALVPICRVQVPADNGDDAPDSELSDPQQPVQAMRDAPQEDVAS